MANINGDLKETIVLGESSQGHELRGNLLRVTRYLAVFEIYNPNLVLAVSEVISGFKIVMNDTTIYSGSAVLSSVLQTASMLVCEAKLDETAFTLRSFEPGAAPAEARAGFDQFFLQWQNLYRVEPEFKVAVADMQTFLTDLRLWLEQLELEIRAAPSGDRHEVEKKAVQEIGRSVVPAFDVMHERLERISSQIQEDLRPVHQNFAKRLLHPLLLCSPFGYRTFNKPLGYAGDYEMVNMIARDPFEGSSAFAKVVNFWFLSQWPARAHRNRITYLKETLTKEAMRAARDNRPMRVLNLGCGPAWEIQEFLATEKLSDLAQFTLLDFNVETIEHVTRALEGIRQQHGRSTRIQVQKKSVQQLLKEAAKPMVSNPNGKFDFIYCAGLFDYLPDRTCKMLMNIFYDWVAPGGLVVATNVADTQPFRHMLEFVLDWHLIYRNTRRAAALVPDRAPRDEQHIFSDPTAVNLFIEARKPTNG
jgi:extracellular factor (EF) 3-hydroxypalmitic acid methyl ester biosynthesis protein